MDRARNLPVVMYPILAGLAFVAGSLGAWYSDTTLPIVVHSREITNSPVNPGGEIRVRYVITRYRICSGKTERIMIDSSQTRFTLESTAFENTTSSTGLDEFNITVKVPVAMAQGPAEYRMATVYECNPLHEILPLGIKGPVNSIKFEVRGNPPPAQLVIPLESK